MAESGSRGDRNGEDDSNSLWEDVSDQEIDLDTDEIVVLLRQALKEEPEGDPARADLLSSLGHALFDRYQKTGVVDDLDEAIEIARGVINAMPNEDPERPSMLNDLGIRLGERYLRNGVIADFNEAKQTLRRIADLPPNDGLDRASYLYNLGILLGQKYLRTSNLADLEESILVTRQAVAETPEDHPEWVARVNNLGSRLSDRHSETGAISDLIEATSLARKALEAASEDRLDYPGLLANLGALLGDQFSETGVTAKLDDAIQYMRKAVYVVPSGHPRQAMLLSNLGNLLGKRYVGTGRVGDLEESIQVLRQAVSIMPDDDPGQAAYLNNLGLQLGDRYLRMGTVSDLDEAIRYLQQAVETTTEEHLYWPTHVNNLGVLLGDRYLRTGAMADLDEAIRILRQAIDATPKSRITCAALLTNLGIQLSSRYSRTKDEADLEAAIQATRRGLDSTSEDHPNRMVQLDILAILLGRKYSETRALTDLEEAIQVARKVVNIVPQDHQYRAGVLNNLGDELGNLYKRTKDIADLEEALKHLRDAVKIMPQDYPDQSAVLGNLGDQLNIRYTKLGEMKDRQDAIAYYQRGLNHASSYTLSRIHAGRGLLRCAPDWQQAYAAAKLTVGLVHRLSSRSLQNSDRQYALGQVVGLASDAAAVALQAGQTAVVALSLLEQGRGVLGTSIEEIRTDVSDLRGRDRELAKQFVRLRDELETPATKSPQILGGDLKMSWQARASRRYEAGKEFDELVAKIRTLSGFEDFLLPPSETEIKAAARPGPIVVVNVSRYRCDALLVEQHQIRALPLTQLSFDEVEDKAPKSDLESQEVLGSQEVLEWLWDMVTEPILEALGFTGPPPSENSWPHVWWIATGPLSKFPLHAAGYHSVGSAETVLDRVMSSYASSIKPIIHGRRRRLQPSTSTQALLVAMEHTPGNDVLPFATNEVAMLRHLCGSMLLNPVEPGRRKQVVTSHLQHCRIFHFAGHGATDSYDASNSRLILEDGALRVAELLEMNLLERSPFLAYLSACGTGRIKDDRSVDESIHLMAAFQLAGFRHVVGTLWEVKDELCVDMARITYEGMRDGAMTDESVCCGLHHACRTLRDQFLEAQLENEDRSLLPEKRTVASSTCCEGSKKTRSWRDVDALDAGPALWAPYVHFGV